MKSNLFSKHNLIKSTLLIFYVFFCTLLLNHGHNWGGDFSSYIMQTDAIANHTIPQFLEDNAFTVFNSNILVGPTAYPWGFPVILLPFYLIFGLNPIFLKIPNIIFFTLFLLVLNAYLEKNTNTYERILIISIFAFNPIYTSIQNDIMSEIPYLFFTTLSIYLMGNYFHYQNKIPKNCFPGITIGISIFMSLFLRNTGFLLLIVLFISQATNLIINKIKPSRKNILTLLLPYAIILLSYAFISISLPGGGDGYSAFYSSLKTGFFNIVINNIKDYFFFPRLFFRDIPSIDIFYYFIFLFFIIGMISKFKHDYIAILYSAFLLSLYIISPFSQGIRYLLSILPFFIYFSIHGMKVTLSKLTFLKQKYQTIFISVFWGTILLIFFLNSAKLVLINLYFDRTVPGPFDEYSLDMFDYIKENTEEDSVIIFFKPRVMKLMTGRNSLLIRNCDEFIKGDYISYTNEQRYKGQLTEDNFKACHLDLTLLYENENFRVYKNNK